MSEPHLIAVMGPTASGKTGVAEEIAERLKAQLINADAFQVYKGLDIGTAKPSRRELYELLDIKAPDEQIGVGEWVLLAVDVLQRLFQSGRSAVIVGGTGFYIRALFEGYDAMAGPPDEALRILLVERLETEGLESLANELIEKDPEAAARIDLRNPARVRRALERWLDPSPKLSFALPPFKKLKIGLVVPLEQLNSRIDQRVLDMLEKGWLQEVQQLLDAGVARNAPGMRAIGYETLCDVLAGNLSLDEGVLQIQARTRQYAKRQRTWLRSEPLLRQFEAEKTREAIDDLLLFG